MTQPHDERPDTPAEDAPEAGPAETAPVDDAAEAAPAQTAHAEAAPDSAPEAAPDSAFAHGGADVGPTTSDGGFGDPHVDDAVARLEELTERPVSEHAAVFDDIHQRLREALEEAAVEPAEEPRG